MALEKRFYGDPSETVDELRRKKGQRIEVKECGGCRHREMFFGEPKCVKGRRVLERCRDFDKRRMGE